MVRQFRDAAAQAGYDPAALPVVVHVNGVVGEEVPQAQRMPLTGSPEQIAVELGSLRELGRRPPFSGPNRTRTRVAAGGDRGLLKLL